MIQWLIAKKDIITSIVGGLQLLGVVALKLQEFLASGSVDPTLLFVSIGGAVIAWFTGKKAQ